MAFPVAAALQIFDDVVRAPGFQAGALSAVEAGREPAGHETARQGPPAPVRAKHVLRRVAGAAMRKPRDEISAAIPGRALVLVGLEDARLEEQVIPGPH